MISVWTEEKKPVMELERDCSEAGRMREQEDWCLVDGM